MIVYVFGSRITENIKSHADLDLVVEQVGKESIPLVLILDLKAAFEESDLPFKVDVVDYTLPSNFQRIIDQHKVILLST